MKSIIVLTTLKDSTMGKWEPANIQYTYPGPHKVRSNTESVIFCSSRSGSKAKLILSSFLKSCCRLLFTKKHMLKTFPGRFRGHPQGRKRNGAPIPRICSSRPTEVRGGWQVCRSLQLRCWALRRICKRARKRWRLRLEIGESPTYYILYINR